MRSDRPKELRANKPATIALTAKSSEIIRPRCLRRQAKIVAFPPLVMSVCLCHRRIRAASALSVKAHEELAAVMNAIAEAAPLDAPATPARVSRRCSSMK